MPRDLPAATGEYRARRGEGRANTARRLKEDMIALYDRVTVDTGRAVACNRRAPAASQGLAKMTSEYDFLAPYSRGLRRAAIVLAGIGIVLAAVVPMVLVVAVPLQPRSNADATVAVSESAPEAALAQSGAPPAAKAEPRIRTADIGAALVAQPAPEPTPAQTDSTGANTAATSPASAVKLSPKSSLTHLKLDERALARADPTTPFPAVQPLTDAAVPSAKLPAAGAAPPPAPKPVATRPKAEKPPPAAPRAAENVTQGQQRVRPEPFSIQEFLASHP